MNNIFLIIPDALEKFNLETQNIVGGKDLDKVSQSSTGAKLENGVYSIPVTGVLLKNANPLYRLMGIDNTGYSEIINNIKYANVSDDVISIELRIDSPGGELNHLKQAMDAIKESKKPVTAIVDGMAASAAYGIASQSKEVIAANNWVEVGSVGVIAYYMSTKDLENKIGVKTLVFRSKQSPKKNLDIDSKEGGEELQKRLDEYGTLFYEQIAAGRGQSVKFVEENYGEGRMFLAEESYKRRMIDGIKTTEKTEEKTIETIETILTTGGSAMEDLQNKNDETETTAKTVVVKENRVDTWERQEQYFNLIAEFPKYKDIIMTGYNSGVDVRDIKINILELKGKDNNHDIFLPDVINTSINSELKQDKSEDQHIFMLEKYREILNTIANKE